MKTMYTNALTKRGGKKPTTAEPDKEENDGAAAAVNPKKMAKSVRKPKTKAAAAEASDTKDVKVVVEEAKGSEPTLKEEEKPKGRTTRSKTNATDEVESKEDKKVEDATVTMTEDTATKTTTTDTKNPPKTQAKEAPSNKTALKEEPIVPSEDSKDDDDDDSKSMDQIEAGLASMAIRGDDKAGGENESPPAPLRRFSRFGRRLATPTKYKDFILGAARRNNNSNAAS